MKAVSFVGAVVLLICGSSLSNAQITYERISFPGAQKTYASGISGSNIVGWYRDARQGFRGFLFNGTNWTSIEAQDTSQVINTYVSGVYGSRVVGYYQAIGETQGFVEDGTNFKSIDYPTAVHGTAALGISGEKIVGNYLDADWNPHGFLFDGTNFFKIDHPSGVSRTTVAGISGSKIVGNYTEANNTTHGFLFDGTNYINVDHPLGIGRTSLTGISESRIIGDYENTNNGHQGFVYDGTNYVNVRGLPSGISGNRIVSVEEGIGFDPVRSSGDPIVESYLATIPTPKAQSITFNALSGVDVNTAPFTLSALATSLLPVTFTCSDPSIASVTSAGRITILKAGTTTITASQAGNSAWDAATPVSQSLVVNKRSQTIAFPVIPTKTVGNIPFALAATASSGLAVTYTSSNTNVATVIGKVVTIRGAGTANIVATQAGNANWAEASPTTKALVVNKASAVVTLGRLSQTYNGGGKSISVATVPANLGVTTTYNGDTNLPVNAGRYAVTSTINAPNRSGSRSGILVIAKAGNAIAFPLMPRNTFGQAPYSLNSASASSRLPITYTSSAPGVARVVSNTLTIVGAGTTIIRASQAGDSNYVAAIPVARTLVVAKANQTVSFSPISPVSFVQNGTFNLSASSTAGTNVTFTSGTPTRLSIVGGTATMKAKGSISVKATAPATPNYNAASATATITLQ